MIGWLLGGLVVSSDGLAGKYGHTLGTWGEFCPRYARAFQLVRRSNQSPCFPGYAPPKHTTNPNHQSPSNQPPIPRSHLSRSGRGRVSVWKESEGVLRVSGRYLRGIWASPPDPPWISQNPSGDRFALITRTSSENTLPDATVAGPTESCPTCLVW